MKAFNLNIKIMALDKFSTTFASIGSKMDRLGKRARGFGKDLSIGLSAPLAGFGIMAVKRASDFETLRTALETATGSVDNAKDKFAELQKFAATTPFALEETVQAFIKLKNLGLDPSNEALTAYGNTSGAMGKSLMQMIEAVADASTLEFERLKEFGIRANQQGKYVTFTFQGVKTKVKKDAGQIEAYLRKLGMVNFAGGMDKQAKTIGGAFSNLQDSISGSLDIIGTDIAKTFNLNERARKLGDILMGLANAFNKLPAPVKDFAISAGLVLALLGPLIAGVGQLVIGFGVMVALAPQIAAGFAAISVSGALMFAAIITIGVLIVGIIMLFTRLVDNVGGVGNAFKVMGAIILDLIVAPLRIVLGLVTKIWSLFGKPPDFLVNETVPLSSRLAQQYSQETQGAADKREGQAMRDLYALQNRAMKGDKAAIEILFKNPPAGMKASVVENKGTNLTVDQGVAMGGVN